MPKTIMQDHQKWDREQADLRLIELLDQFRARTTWEGNPLTALPAVRFLEDGRVVITAKSGVRGQDVSESVYMDSHQAVAAYQTLLDFLGAKPDNGAYHVEEDSIIGDDVPWEGTYVTDSDGVADEAAEDDGRISAVFMHEGRKVAEFYDLASAIAAIKSMVDAQSF